jgi:uncharacterized tellurite resistance protein B-like protein
LHHGGVPDNRLTVEIEETLGRGVTCPGTERRTMDKNDQIQICKVIAQAIMADAQITDEEHEFLTRLMDRYELDEAQRKDVMNRNMDDDPAAMVKEIGGLESKDELLGELLSAIAVDGEVAPQEKALLQTVGKAIGMTPEELEMVLEN